MSRSVGTLNYKNLRCKEFILWLVSDFLVVVASIVVLAVGSNGQVFATSAIR